MRTVARSALTALALVLSAPAFAQEATPAPEEVAPDADADAVEFSAETVEYQTETEVVTASGEVRMSREGNRLRADRVVYDRRTGRVTATGNVAVTNPAGDTAYGDSVELTDTLRDGVVDNLLIVLEDGGRLAARRATRTAGAAALDYAAYTPCVVRDAEGCPKTPTWQIEAVRVVQDPVRRRIYYRGAQLRLFGVPILPLPALSHPYGQGNGGTGLLVPDVKFGRANGVELAQPVHLRLAPNRDLTITPHVYSKVLPAIEARYRQLDALGAVQLGGFLTYGSRLPASVLTGDEGNRQRDVRGYFEANGRAQFDPVWSLTAATRVATDKTVLRRYDISRDDRLRSVVDLERVGVDSYLSLAGWAFQGLRADDRQGTTPLVLPALDARLRLPDPLLGGRIELQANSLALFRTEGQDTQRLFAGARWDRRSLTGLGQELTLTALVRGDLYHSRENGRTAELIYRGESGFQARGIAVGAADVQWPFVGPFAGGTQRLTPRVQLVATPPVENLDIPNEDSRAVDLEDSNLFSLNRFAGYDRWEDSSRVTYGVDYAWDRPNLSLRATVGQSYRLNRRPGIFPDGTGLTDRLSDIVGRTELEVGRFVDVTHRYRVDKDSFTIRRNEIDLTLGGRQTYVTVGYLRLDRDIPQTFEDLRDREEVRIGGRARFLRYWSVFGSALVDLTDGEEDPVTDADGYEPVRHRLGFAYEDDCFEFGVTWRRDYERVGDARRGNSFLFRLAFRNLGR